MQKYVLKSNTALQRKATVYAKSEQEAIYKAYAIWDRRAIKSGEEPPVCWGVSEIKIILAV